MTKRDLINSLEGLTQVPDEATIVVQLHYNAECNFDIDCVEENLITDYFVMTIIT